MKTFAFFSLFHLFDFVCLPFDLLKSHTQRGIHSKSEMNSGEAKKQVIQFIYWWHRSYATASGSDPLLVRSAYTNWNESFWTAFHRKLLTNNNVKLVLGTKESARLKGKGDLCAFSYVALLSEIYKAFVVHTQAILLRHSAAIYRLLQ